MLITKIVKYLSKNKRELIIVCNSFEFENFLREQNSIIVCNRVA